jgi:multiple sugar transport system permease protein
MSQHRVAAVAAGNPLARRALTAGTYAVLAVFAGLTLTPFLYLLTSALKTRETFFRGVFLPRGKGFLGVDWDGVTLDNFARLADVGMGRALANSVFLASATALLATLCCAAGGYALACFEFRGRRWATGLVLAALLIPAPLLLAPGYQWLFRLGLLDTHAGLILPALAPAFGVFLFRQAALQSVPREMLQAARLDGCGEVGLFTFVLPMLRPMAGAFLMITFLATWNNFIGPQIVLQSPDKQPLSVAVAQLRGLYATDFGLLMAGTLLSVAPVAALFLLMQREFLSGLTSGAVKG